MQDITTRNNKEWNVKGGKNSEKMGNLRSAVGSLVNSNEHTGNIHKGERDEESIYRYTALFEVAQSKNRAAVWKHRRMIYDGFRSRGERAKYLAAKNTCTHVLRLCFLPFRAKEFSITSS